MLGLLTRLFRVFWRQESEGSRSGAIVIAFPEAREPTAVPVQPPVPVAFIRLSADTAAPASRVSSRQLAARLQSVQRLNPPTSRPRTKASISNGGKPRPLAAEPAVRSSRVTRPGFVLDRIAAHHRKSAEIVNLSDVRRARQIESTDMEIALLFN